MRLEFTYRRADLAEALAPATMAGNRRSYARLIGLAVWVLLVMIVTVIYFIAQSAATPVRLGLLPQPDPNPQLDLWQTLLPSLAPALLVWIVLAQTLLGVASFERKQAQNIARTAAIAMGLVIFVTFWILIQPSLKWAWRPSRLQINLVATAPWLTMIPLLLMFNGLFRRARVRVEWGKNPSWQRPKVLELTSDGWAISDGVFQLHYGWSYFKSARETENLLLLIAEDARIHILPKRFFADASQIDAVRALIHNNIAETHFLPGTAAFPVVEPKPVVPLPPG